MRLHNISSGLLIACLALPFQVPALGASTDTSPATPFLFSARNGATGLIRTPSAEVMQDGAFRITDFSLYSPPATPQLGDEAAYGFSFGFLPRVEFGITYSDPSKAADLSGNYRVQLLTARGLRPAIAIGTLDVKGNVTPDTNFVALTEHLLNGRARITAGYLQGNTRSGYAGAEIGVIPHLAVVGEYDSKDVNYGARAAVYHNMFQFAAEHVREGWQVQAGVELPLSTIRPAPAGVELPPPAATLDDATALGLIQQKLRGMGLENLSARVAEGSARTLEVSYENRSFPHSEMDALANVLATAAVYTPNGVTALSAVTLRDGIPILRVTTPLAEYRDYMAGRIGDKALAKVFVARYSGSVPPGLATITRAPRVNSSYGHADVLLRPTVGTEFATDNWQIGIAPALLPEVYVPLAKGVSADFASYVPIGGGFGIRHPGPLLNPLVPNTNPQITRLALNVSWHPTSWLLSRSFVGRFPGLLEGAFSEALFVPPSNPRIQTRLSGGVVSPMSGPGPQMDVYNFDASYYFPDLDFTARYIGGKFLQGDTGNGIDFVRRFGVTDLGIQVRDTTIGRAGAVFISLPIGPGHLPNNPSDLRFRPGDFFTYGQRTLLTRPNYLYTAAITANELITGTPATYSLLSDNQINPAYVLRSLPDLRRVRLFQIYPPIHGVDAPKAP